MEKIIIFMGAIFNDLSPLSAVVFICFIALLVVAYAIREMSKVCNKSLDKKNE
ncbi:MAG: hypothetical protein JKY84_09515 [Emcibacteraceae bacterium]|nr:hypothetical protein [Emcibacteraceae bacterium]